MSSSAFFAIQFHDNDNKKIINFAKKFILDDVKIYPEVKLHTTICYCKTFNLENIALPIQIKQPTTLVTKNLFYCTNSYQFKLEIALSKELINLRNSIINHLKKHKINFDQTTFKPHITLSYSNKTINFSDTISFTNILNIKKIVILKTNNNSYQQLYTLNHDAN